MTLIVIAGPDPHSLGDALVDAGSDVERISGEITTTKLEAARVGEADVFVLTDPMEATALALVREEYPSLSLLVYADQSLPPFASHLVDVALSPRAMDQTVVVEELLSLGDRRQS